MIESIKPAEALAEDDVLTETERQESLNTFLTTVHKRGFFWGALASNAIYSAEKLGLDKMDTNLVTEICTAYALHFLYRLKYLLKKHMNGEEDRKNRNKWTLDSHIGHHGNTAVFYLRDFMKKTEIAALMLECRLVVYEYIGSYIHAAKQRTYGNIEEYESALSQAAIAEEEYEEFEFAVRHLGAEDDRDLSPIAAAAQKVVEAFDADPELQQDPDAIRMRIAERFPYRRFGLRSALEA